MWALVQEGTIQEIIHSPKTIKIGDVTHPKAIFTLWPESHLKAIGIYPIKKDLTNTPDWHYKGESTYTFDGLDVIETAKFIARSLNEVKEEARQRINDWKAYKQQTDFIYLGTAFQCDLESRTLITGAALDALIAKQSNTAFSITWIDSNNEKHELDADGMIALGKAAKDHVEYWHQQALIKKAQVEMANSVEDVQAVVITLT